MSDILDIDKLKQTLLKFSADRQWQTFHNPKNLSMALAGEAGELLELFQWLSLEEALQIKDNAKYKKAVAYEIADVLTYAVQLAAQLDISISDTILEKIKLNEKKYPVEEFQGNIKDVLGNIPANDGG